MQIDRINSYNKLFICNKNNKTNPIYNNNQYANLNFMATARVNKDMASFYQRNIDKFPDTIMSFLESLTDKFQFSPIETQKQAFIGLMSAKNIQDVKNIFPKEKLFSELKTLDDTKASVGLLAVYREFKDLYEDGILKNGEDLTVYLLKKIFLEAKIIDEINVDIDKDLNDDIRAEFKRKNPDSDYISSSTLKSLGIILPDTAYLNSLKFTREGYSDEFGIKISQGQLKYWNSLTDEQKFEILSKRCEGRDKWWNNLTYDEKLELAAGVDSDDDLFRNYKRFLRATKKEITEGKYEQPLDRPTKKIKVGASNLKDKDIFNLWFRKNIEKFYSLLSEADKDSVHIKRVRKLAVRWQEMTPEERTELINKMREGREPLRYAMIDTWNHCRPLIRELSDFLKAQQIFKPVDLLYSSQEFSEFQSKVMTEFWANNRELAEDFGQKLSRAIARVESSIQRGQFEDLKQEILRDKAERIRILSRERYNEEQKLKEEQRIQEAKLKEQESISEVEQVESAVKEADIPDYKDEFIEAYRLYFNKDNIFPAEYVDIMMDNMLNGLPKETIEKITKACRASFDDLPQELVEEIQRNGFDNKISKELARAQKSLEFAISQELYSWSKNPSYLTMPSIVLMGKYKEAMRRYSIGKKYPSVNNVKSSYNKYQKDLTPSEIKGIIDNYFILKYSVENPEEYEKELADYIASYGCAAFILLSDKSAYSDEVKQSFNGRFLAYMPQKIKDKCAYAFESQEDIAEERTIQQIKGKIARRFDFMPDEFLNVYTKEVAKQIWVHKKFNLPDNEEYSVKNYLENMCKKRTRDNLEASSIKLPKQLLERDVKIHMLAAEQALADELSRISGNERIYSLEIEDLCNIFELLLFTKKNAMEITDADNDLTLTAKVKPNIKRVELKYREYLNNLREIENEVFDKYSIKDKEKLLFTLNPDEERESIDIHVLKRIGIYS